MATYNPWRGCSKVSPGCAECYMYREQRRFGHDPESVVRTTDATFYAPLRSKRWRELPAGALVFTCSWSDWFHEDADPWRDAAWEVLRARPDLRWQILTKRPERILDQLPSDWGKGWPNVWLGVSVENRRFVWRADLLREVPAAVRFISAEPILGPLLPEGSGKDETSWDDKYSGEPLCLEGIDWLIVGGESGGPRRRRLTDETGSLIPERLRWIRSLRDACRDRDTAFFLKQLGGPASSKGDDPRDWPEDLRIREFPGVRPPGG